MLSVLAKLVAGSSIVKWVSLGFLVLVLLSLHTSWKHRKTRSLIQKACKDTKAKIFIALLGEHSPTNTAQTLFSIFEGALCPHNVRVGLYECIDDSDSNAVDVYKAMAEKNATSGIVFADNITVLQRFAQDQGPYAALKTIMEHGRQQEEYIMTLSDSIHLAKGWDKKLTELSARSMQTAFVIPTTASFLRITGFLEDMPLFEWSPLRVVRNVPAKFWRRDCTFAPASFWKTWRDLPHLGTHGTNFIVTADASAWKLVHPCKHVIASALPTDFESVWQPTKASYKEALNVIKLLPTLKNSLQALGMYETVSKEAKCGVVDANDDDEILAKYGSKADYNYQ